MATLVYSLSSKTDKVTGLHEVLIRFFHGRLNQRAKSGLFISAEYWNDELQRNFVPKFRLMNDQQRALVEELTGQNEVLQKLSAHIHKSFIEAGAGKDPLPKDWLVATVDMYMNPPILESSEEEQIVSRRDQQPFRCYRCIHIPALIGAERGGSHPGHARR